jgi:hypothetical protein
MEIVMKNLIYIMLIVVFITLPVLSQNAPQDTPIANLKITGKKLLYIGFEKNTSEDQRLLILNKTDATNIEELNIMDYPLFRIEFDNDKAGIKAFEDASNQLKDESGVRFVSDEQNWENDENRSVSIKRQGKMNIPKEKTLPQSSKEYYHGIILNHMPGLNRCVEKQYPIGKRKKIKALYQIVINKKGAVEEVRLLSSNIKEPELRTCLKSKISTWHDFPRRREDENLTVKFKFSY